MIVTLNKETVNARMRRVGGGRGDESTYLLLEFRAAKGERREREGRRQKHALPKSTDFQDPP